MNFVYIIKNKKSNYIKKCVNYIKNVVHIIKLK